jgi:hypothetical protein
MWDVLGTTLCDEVCQWLAAGLWFSPGTPVFSTDKTDHHDIAEILLKVALNTITITLFMTYFLTYQAYKDMSVFVIISILFYIVNCHIDIIIRSIVHHHGNRTNIYLDIDKEEQNKYKLPQKLIRRLI